jgi:hypothetical protein
MAHNREEQSILFAYENGTINEIAVQMARRNEQNFKYNWTVEQHEEALIKKAKSLLSDVTAPSKRSHYQGKATRPMPGTAEWDLFVDHCE